MEEIIIYGAGNMGKALYTILKGKCKVDCFLDRNAVLQGTYAENGILVMNPEDKKICRKKTVVVAIVACKYESVKHDLEKLGYLAVTDAGSFLEKKYEDEYVEFANLWKFHDPIDMKSYLELFKDEESKRNWYLVCEWFSDRKETKYYVTDRKRYFPEFLKKVLDKCQIMLDTAALNGEYIDYFLNQDKKREVYALTLKPTSMDYQLLEEKYPGRLHLHEFEAGEVNGEIMCRRIGMMEPFTSWDIIRCKVKRLDDIEFPKIDYLRCYSMSKIEPIFSGGGGI